MPEHGLTIAELETALQEITDRREKIMKEDCHCFAVNGQAACERCIEFASLFKQYHIVKSELTHMELAEGKRVSKIIDAAGSIMDTFDEREI